MADRPAWQVGLGRYERWRALPRLARTPAGGLVLIALASAGLVCAGDHVLPALERIGSWAPPLAAIGAVATLGLAIAFYPVLDRYRYHRLVLGPAVASVGPGFRLANAFRRPETFEGWLEAAQDAGPRRPQVVGRVEGVDLRVVQFLAGRPKDEEPAIRIGPLSLHGTVLAIDFNKDFAGRTCVLDADWTTTFLRQVGKLLPAVVAEHGEVVELEDAEFAERFVVLSTDQVEARYVLSPLLMRRLLEVRDRLGHRVNALFDSSTLFLVLDLQDDLFRPPPVDVDTRQRVLDVIALIEFAVGRVGELGLDRRIFTKE